MPCATVHPRKDDQNHGIVSSLKGFGSFIISKSNTAYGYSSVAIIALHPACAQLKFDGLQMRPFILG